PRNPPRSILRSSKIITRRLCRHSSMPSSKARKSLHRQRPPEHLEATWSISWPHSGPAWRARLRPKPKPNSLSHQRSLPNLSVLRLPTGLGRFCRALRDAVTPAASVVDSSDLVLGMGSSLPGLLHLERYRASG